MRTQRETDLEDEVKRLTAERDKYQDLYRAESKAWHVAQARVDELEGVGRELINALDDERISDLTHLYERLDGLLAIKALEGEVK